ncbi:MAG: hypothetical protein ABI851_08630 [Saprospiraceae bacterium]
MRLLLLFSLISVKLIASPTDFNLICPSDITVDCTIDYTDLNQFGKAYVDHNGTIIWVKDCKVIYNINECGYGTISRTWGVEDPDWKWITCTQIITLTNINAFGEKDITWPRDLIIESCNPEQDLKTIGKPYDRPYYKSNKCAKPLLNYSDSRFQVSDGCLKIVRTWKILDWCIYDPYKNPYVGIFSHIQVIKLITVDTAARLTCTKAITVDATKECKGADVKIDLAKVSSPCNMPYIIYNTSAYSDTNTADASGFYPVGSHHFYYVAEYACGKELKCDITVTVLSKIPPVPYCKDGIVIDLMPIDSDGNGSIDEGMIDVWAKDLDHGSYHPCPGQKLKYSFSSDTATRSKRFTCKEIGENEVEIWITDSLGNQDHCKTRVIIQNNIGIPDCKKPDSLQHKFFELNINLKNARLNKPMDKILLLAENMSNHSVDTATQSGIGEYQFVNLAMESTHKLSFEWNKINKPNFEDLRWLEKYLSGKLKNSTGYQVLAADLNHDNQIDNNDLQLLRNRYYSNINSIQPSYKIVPTEFKYLQSEEVLDAYSKLEMLISDSTEALLVKNFELLEDGIFNVSIGTGTVFNETGGTTGINSILKDFSITYLDKERMLCFHPINMLPHIVELKLYNSLGQLMFSKSMSMESEEFIPLSQQLTDGLYILKVDNKLSKIYLFK